MNWIAGVVLIVVSVVGTALTLMTLPGLWLIVLVGLVFWAIDPGLFSVWTVVVVVVLGVAAELIELAAGSAASTLAGGGRRAAVGAAVGGIVGAIAGTIVLSFLPVIGTVIGAAAGAGIGAAVMEPTALEMTRVRRVKIGSSAAVGRVASLMVKTTLCAVMGVVITVAAFVS